MKISRLISSLLILLASITSAAPAAAPPKAFGPVPTARQMRWHELELYAFIHFGVDTFTDREWGFGDENPALFNPSEFDANQIAAAARAGGMKGLIFVAKHHDGLCLWPTKSTRHNISATPYKNGKGDMVKEMAAACEKAGLKFGVYVSPWDRNHAEYGSPGYVTAYHQQINELTSNYGPIFEMWFDGACGGDGYYGGKGGSRSIHYNTYYGWKEIQAIIRKNQPDCAIWGAQYDEDGRTHFADCRWGGSEQGDVGNPCWHTLSSGKNLKTPADHAQGERHGDVWCPAEGDVSIRPGWFWHENENRRVKSPEQLMNIYLSSIGRGSNLILNIPPDRRGLIHENDVSSMTGFGRHLQATFATRLEKGATCAASNIRGNDASYGPGNLLDPDRWSAWITDDDVLTPEVTFTLSEAKVFNLIRLREDVRLGQRIEGVAVDAMVDGVWNELATAPCVGATRLLRVPQTTATQVRVRITKSAACPALSDFGLFLEPKFETWIPPIGFSYDVIWDSPSKDAAGSMPLGNGELGINLWVEENGDLLFYLGRNDTFSEVSQLCKAGMVRVSLSPNPFLAGAPFRQELKLRDGVCGITAGAPGKEVSLKVFVDSASPVVHVLGKSGQPLVVTAKVASWRKETQAVPGESAWTLANGPHTLTQSADVFPKRGENSVSWYHRNENAFAFEETIRVQSLESIRDTLKDPLLHRTFGGWVTGAGFQSTDDLTIATPQPVREFHLRVACPSEQTPTADTWLKSAESIAKAAEDGPGALARTTASWRAFWERSWVNCDTGAGSNMTVGKAHTLQRYMQACAGRSVFPIKFNGSIFTVEPKPLGNDGNPDWRRWGDCHWWQNVRMPYHAMQAAGDFDLMMPLFDTFERIRPFAEARAKLYHNAEGCYFAETMTVWGTYANGDYGWDRTGKQAKDVDSPYWRYAWNQGLEVVALMLDYYVHTEDKTFLEKRLLPMATSVLKYFDTRFRKDADGRIILDPTQSVETYWHEVINDTPTVAGLHDVTVRLCTLPEDLTSPGQRKFFTHMKAAAPVIPIEDARLAGKTVRRIAVAQKYNPQRSNCENPELFPIWPFRVFGLERPMLEEARNAYQLRGSHNDVGWGYDSNAAALLGMTDEAARIMKVKMANSNAAYRWPATWGPNFDWLPDQCHGGNLMATINYMLLQHSGDKILLLPAWPKDWDVSFKLHAPRQTTVEVIYSGGKIEKLEVLPQERRKDITLPAGIEAP